MRLPITKEAVPIMQDDPALCHASRAHITHNAPFVPVLRSAQHVATTASRRTGPRAWLRTVEWLVASGHHPKATPTTLTVARELARRMHYDTGHVRYSLAVTMDRTGLSRSAITAHVRILRELGALVWVEHGTRANVRRALGLPGYAGTATVYAAAIPAVYDRALGHRIAGSGYAARPVKPARRPVDNRPGGAVDNRRNGSSWTPSLTVVPVQVKAQVVGGVTTTARRSDKNSTTRGKASSSGRRATILGRKVTAAGMAAGDRLAREVRRRLPWARRASHDQLRWALADMAEQGWTVDRTLAWLSSAASVNSYAGLLWQPRRPHSLIAHALRQDADQQAREEQARAQQAEHEQATTQAVPPNAAYRAAVADIRDAPDYQPEPPGDDRALTRDELWQLRAAAEQDPGMVLAHVSLCGLDEAIRVFGHGLTHRTLNAHHRDMEPA